MIPAHKGETDRQMKLIPPDKKRCQCIKQEVNPWAFGIASPVRCKNKPTVIIKERAKPYGEMSLCADCHVIAKKQMRLLICRQRLSY